MTEPEAIAMFEQMLGQSPYLTQNRQLIWIAAGTRSSSLGIRWLHALDIATYFELGTLKERLKQGRDDKDTVEEVESEIRRLTAIGAWVTRQLNSVTSESLLSSGGLAGTRGVVMTPATLPSGYPNPASTYWLGDPSRLEAELIE